MSLIVSQILRFIQYVSSKLSPDYHTSNSHKCTGVNGEALQLHAVLKKQVLYHKSHKNLNQYCHAKIRIRYLLRVTSAAPELAMVRMIKSLSP